MTAKDILSYHKIDKESYPLTSIDASMPVIDILPRLLDSPHRLLRVTENGKDIGIIDSDSLLEGIGKMIAPRDDCSIITVECTPQDYSAGMIAHAIEDTDAHLVDILTTPSHDGLLNVTLRVRNSDPSQAVRSLERYNYHVVDSHPASIEIQSIEIATERLLSLQTLMNV